MRPFYEELPEQLRVGRTDAHRFPEHLHTQLELLYVFLGNAVMQVDDQTYFLRPGDLCVCFPGAVHGYLEGESADGLMMIFAPEILGDFGILDGSVCPKNPVIEAARMPPDIPLCMEQLLHESQQGKDPRVLRGYLQVVMARVLPLLTVAKREKGVSEIVYRLLKYLSLHFTESISLQSLARELGVSCSYLSHVFSGRLGANFRTYLNTLRVDHAGMLLKSTQLSVTQIAYECGFDAQRTFNRAFLAKYGISPTEYRRREGEIREPSAS